MRSLLLRQDVFPPGFTRGSLFKVARRNETASRGFNLTLRVQICLAIKLLENETEESILADRASGFFGGGTKSKLPRRIFSSK